MDITIRSILVGQDGTEEAQRAAAMAAKLAQCFSAEIILAGAVEPPSAEQQAEGYGLESPEESERRVSTMLEQTASDLGQAGVTVRIHLLKGEAEKALAEFANKTPCDLIVIGHRHISRVRRWLEGSTSSGLLKDSNVSLLVVR